ncbi:hypothetical protein [Flavobacterium difficile]|uniref:PepSY domain-containing protein n=1 Tax=Flavobacterium difficile TaxID=2709659 RepID=A0ABX0IAY0_9FLAO|nr:hypothetical protein [Flavobacterium difficile]NHM02847.1 hypothetical protein [Flavobacterium difficile]
MKLKFLFVYLIFPLSIFSQKIKTENIIKTTDSILTATIGENLFKYFTISEGSFYKYKTNNNYNTTGKFLSKRVLRKKVTEIWVLYHFQSEELQIVETGFWIKLNEKLNLIEPIKIDFIPDFLKNNSPSNFITIENAENIAIKSFKEKGFEISKPKLKFDEKKGKHIYYSINKVTKSKNAYGQDCGETEIIEIDAISGEVLSLIKGYYGLIIR